MTSLLLDMNVSPRWVDVLESAGYATTHWQSVGDARARDETIIDYARWHGFILVTWDLGIAGRLAILRAGKPSVVQFRMKDALPEALGEYVAQVVRLHEARLKSGAILTIDDSKARVRLLPLGT